MRVCALLRGVALEAEPAELDHHLVGTERRDDVAAQRRAAQIEVHAGEQVDHVPLVRRQVRERERRAALEAFVLVVVHLEGADHDVAVVERLVLAREVGVVEAGHAVMVVHEVVIEFAVGVVPELVVRRHDGLVIVEHLERLGLERLAQALERLAGPLLQIDRIVVEVDPHEAAELHLAAQPAQADVLLAQAILVAFLLAADVDAVALQVELPGVEHAGDALRVSRRLPSRKLPEGRRSISMPRCGQTLRKARTSLSGPRQTMTGSRAIGMCGNRRAWAAPTRDRPAPRCA